MKKSLLSLFVLFGLTSVSHAVVPIGMGVAQSQPVASLRLTVTEATVDELTESAFEEIATELENAEMELELSFFRTLSDDAVEPYVVEVGFLVPSHPESLPVAMQGELPGGLTIHTTLAGEEVDTDAAYEAMENFMLARRLDSREAPFEIYSGEDAQWTRVVWPVSHAGHPAPLPAP